MANAQLVAISAINENGVTTVESPYLVGTHTQLKFSVTSGVNRKIEVLINNVDGEIIHHDIKEIVEISDKFIIDGVTYFGFEFVTERLADGMYVAKIKVFEGGTVISDSEEEVVIDTVAPVIDGEFFWNSYYKAIHTDGKLIVSVSSTHSAGFPSVDMGSSGFDRGTFTSEYIDGDNDGEVYATQPLNLTDEGKLIIGKGTYGSVNSNYIPNNTRREMKLTFTVYDRAGNSSERSTNVYVSTKHPKKPTPYAVYTGADVNLDGNSKFYGFESYSAGMVAPSNPIRMIYRADKREYVGGGGDADIYGGFIRSRNVSRPSYLAHVDDSYVYFDMTGSTEGRELNYSQYWVRGINSWKLSGYLAHDLTLPDELKPPKGVRVDYWLESEAKWNTGVKYTNKDATNDRTDKITKARIIVEPRVYDQKFSFFNTSCIVNPNDDSCEVQLDLPFPGNDINVYSRHNYIVGIGNNLISPYVSSLWYYDGAPAEIVEEGMLNDEHNKTLSFTAKKKYTNRAWGTSQLRDMKLRAKSQSGQKIDLQRTAFTTLANQNYEQLGNASFDYRSLEDGIYSFYAYVEDGFYNTVRHRREHLLYEGIVVDGSPPKILSNFNGREIDSLSEIQIELKDTSDSEIESILLSGGPQSAIISVPVKQLSENLYKLEYIYIKPSEGQDYQLTIIARDAKGNKGTLEGSFSYVPRIVDVEDTSIAAVASPLRSANGRASNRIVTPQIKDKDGSVARGNHIVFFSLDSEADMALIVNGKKVVPGGIQEFLINLSLNNHKIALEVHPENTGEESSQKYEIHIPDIKINVCPEDFEQQESDCVRISIGSTAKHCNSPYELQEDECRTLLQYPLEIECKGGYDRVNDICRGQYEARPVLTCPDRHGLTQDSKCINTTYTAAMPCLNGNDDAYESGMCSGTNDNFVPTGTFCDGHDMSNGEYCTDGQCYTYDSELNACKISTSGIPFNKCNSGELIGNTCIVNHEYQMNLSCDEGFTRNNDQCERLDIIDSRYICDDEFELSGEYCLKAEFVSFIGCPSTHAFVNDRCHELVPVSISCEPGYEWDGAACSQTISEPANPFCHGEDELIDGVCNEEFERPADERCPEDYSWNGNNCEFTNPLTNHPDWAVIVQPEMNCSAGQVLDRERQKCVDIEPTTIPASERCPISTPDYDEGTNTCFRTERRVATPIDGCPVEFTLFQGLCYQTTNYICPTPVIVMGEGLDRFERMIYSRPELVSNNMCIYEEAMLCTTRNRDLGTLKKSKNIGISRPHWDCGIVFAPDFRSPAKLSCDGSRGIESCTPEQIRPIEQILTCPVGYTLNTGTNQCERRIVSPREYYCANDWVGPDSGNQCTRYKETYPGKICSSPFKMFHEERNLAFCGIERYSDKEKYCETGRYDEGHCIGRRPSTTYYQCNDGWKLEDQLCFSDVFVDEIRECNQGTQFDRERCQMPFPQDGVGLCPDDWLSDIDDCTRETRLDAQLFCDVGELINNRCHNTVFDDLNADCNIDEELNDGVCEKMHGVPFIPNCNSPFAILNNQTCQHKVIIPVFN